MSIKFHLPDFAVRYHFNRIFLSMLEHCPQYFYDGVEIASVYGCFPSLYGTAEELCLEFAINHL